MHTLYHDVIFRKLALVNDIAQQKNSSLAVSHIQRIQTVSCANNLRNHSLFYMGLRLSYYDKTCGGCSTSLWLLTNCNTKGEYAMAIIIDLQHCDI